MKNRDKLTFMSGFRVGCRVRISSQDWDTVETSYTPLSVSGLILYSSVSRVGSVLKHYVDTTTR